MADSNYVKALLEPLDGSEPFTFLINPETISYDSVAAYSRLAVLGTNQPLTYYQSSSGGFSIPTVRLWTDNNDQDLSDYIERLRGYTRVRDGAMEPQLLKFSFGSIVFDRVVLTRFTHVERQWRNGVPTQAEGSLEFLLSPVRPEPLKDPVVTELSEREQQEAADLVDQEITSQGLRVKFGLAATDRPVVDAEGNVTLQGRPLGSLKDVLGDKLPPAWANLGQAPEDVQAAVDQAVDTATREGME